MTLARNEGQQECITAAVILEKAILVATKGGESKESWIRLNCILESLANLAVREIRQKQLPPSENQRNFLRRLKVFCNYSLFTSSLQSSLKDILELTSYESFRKHIIPTIYPPDPINKPYHVILLLGAPGCGKSQLGNTLLHQQKLSMFIDIGDRLKKRGELDRYYNVPTLSRKHTLSCAAEDLLRQSLDVYFQTDGSLPIMVTYVKESRHVYSFLEIVKSCQARHGVSILHLEAYYLKRPLDRFIVPQQVDNIGEHVIDTTNSLANKRLNKWMSSIGVILDVLTSSSSSSPPAPSSIPSSVPVLEFTPHTPISNGILHYSWVFTRYLPRFTSLPVVLSSSLRSRCEERMKEILQVTALHSIGPGSFLCTTDQACSEIPPSPPLPSPYLNCTHCIR
jgi:hypothetical protein